MMAQTALGRLTLPGVVILIAFLSYGSQVLFASMEPHPLEPRQKILFNGLVACIWISYFRACFVNPGWISPDWKTSDPPTKYAHAKHRWCKKCEAYKPPRSHHCKICARCIPKMDHHCPWTINCVSHRTFPHFFRFLCYSVAAMGYLEYFSFIRVATLWEGRHRPSYLGPSAAQMISLFVLLMTNSAIFFAISLLLARNIWCLGANVTTIEGWEIERHEILAKRARKHGGYVDGPGGIRVRISKQEFPYDIGILKNVMQGLGGSPLFWVFPFAPTPSNESGLLFEINGFEDAPWPPPDPDRMPRHVLPSESHNVFLCAQENANPEEQKLAFRQRQQEDLYRYSQRLPPDVRRRDPYSQTKPDQARSGNSGWRDKDGERLEDFGVDEDAELDEDDIPLAELLRTRKLPIVNMSSTDEVCTSLKS